MFFCCKDTILTKLMLSRIVRDLKGVQLETTVAFANVVDPGDVGAHLIHHLHMLQEQQNIPVP